MNFEDEIIKLEDELKEQKLRVEGEIRILTDIKEEKTRAAEAIRALDAERRIIVDAMTVFERSSKELIGDSDMKGSECDALKKDIDHFVRIKDEQKRRILEIEQMDLK